MYFKICHTPFSDVFIWETGAEFMSCDRVFVTDVEFIRFQKACKCINTEMSVHPWDEIEQLTVFLKTDRE